ncbi:hypothetical protein GCM10027028_57270 [Streptomyces sundarbansensis]
MAVADELMHSGGGDRHPELVVLDFAGDADLHVDHGPWLGGSSGHNGAHPDIYSIDGDAVEEHGRASLMKDFALSSLTKL